MAIVAFYDPIFLDFLKIRFYLISHKESPFKISTLNEGDFVKSEIKDPGFYMRN